MDRDLTKMIYGALMGVVGSVVSSLVTTLFQFWLARREYEKRQQAELHKQINQIYLPTEEEVLAIMSQSQAENQSQPTHKVTQAGSLVLSVVVSSFLIYQTKNSFLGFAFTAVLGFVVTNRAIQSLKRR